MIESRSRLWARTIFDSLIFILLGIWVLGGVKIHDHLYLKHGADLRRAAIILGILGFPFFRGKSFFLRGAESFSRRLGVVRFRWNLIFGFILFSVFLSVLRSLGLRVPLYDVGIFHQILWSLTQGFGFHSTISGAGNFLLDHFSPSLALLVPAFWVAHASPLFLPIVQPLLLFGGASAWIFLAERIEGVGSEWRQKLAAATTLFVFSFESLWGNLKWGFHENALAFFSLSWAFAFLLGERKERGGWKKPLVLLLFLIAAGSKEILLLDVGFILIGWAWIEAIESKRRAFPLGLVFLASTLFFKFYLFEKMGHPADKNYFNRYYSYLGNDLDSATSQFFQVPFLVFKNIGGKELGRYFFAVFLPWLFLPFLIFWKKRHQAIWLVGILPSLASAALATYSPLRRPEFHYVLELWPILAGMTLFVLGSFRSEKGLWAWALLALLRMDFDPLAEMREYFHHSGDTAQARNLIQKIPQEASVSADELAGTWVAGRKWVMRWPQTFLLPGDCPDFVLLQNSHENLGDFKAHSPWDQILKRCHGGQLKVHSDSAGGWVLFSLGGSGAE